MGVVTAQIRPRSTFNVCDDTLHVSPSAETALLGAQTLFLLLLLLLLAVFSVALV
jgi:hypothetical protein